MENKIERIKKEIFEKIRNYYKIKSRLNTDTKKKIIPYAGAVFDENEIISMVDVLLKGWFGLSEKAREFCNMFSEYLDVSYTVLTNSGSSANLIAVSALKSHKLQNRLRDGDEVLTPAVTFPTTINPIIQNNLVPVIIDVNIDTYNIDIDKLNEAVTSKTKAIMLPHTLGNPNDMDAVLDIVEDRNIYLIEDNCDALGSKFKNRKTGSFGVLSTCSFYPSHHITMGEGGAVCIRDDDIKLQRIIKSIRDWGRDCWCESDEKSFYGACGKRFDWEINGIKYDHRYIYSHIGYNLKPTEIQAAMGVEQLKKLETFNKKRKENFQFLYNKLKIYKDYFSFIKKCKDSDPAWFCFRIRLRDDVPFSRYEIIKYLEENGVKTRLIFGGNITHQPAYKNVNIKVFDSLDNSEKIMRNSFFIGVYPGITKDDLNYIVKVFDSFFEKYNL